jgi:RNA polymerase sigma factor (sigma-70 family)
VLSFDSAPLTPIRPVASPEPEPVSENLPLELNARFRGPLLSFFTRRIKDQTLAQDLTQETLLRVYAASQRTHMIEPESFVFTVAANLLRDQKRSDSRRGPIFHVPIDEAVSKELEQHLVEELSPERILLSRETLQGVLAALEELGERTRNIFVLSRLECMKHKDIAALYGMGLSTVEKHLLRATLHLTARYGDR